MPGPVRPSPRLRAACSAGLSYAEVGATGGPLPPGYRVVERAREVGRGRARYDAVGLRLMTWEAHRRAGLTVEATSDRARVGAVVLLGLGVGRLRVRAPCRVVQVVAEDGRTGFAYGTLPGHPESGEELFLVTLDAEDRVHARVRAFSRPATWWARLGAPVGRVVQDRTTGRYLAALAEP